MDRQQFIKHVTSLVDMYIENFDRFDSDPQIMVNPVSLDVRIVSEEDKLAQISDSDEAIENAAAAQGDETEQALDFQAKQDPEFYPVKKLLKNTSDKKTVADMKAIETIADNYHL